MNYEQTAMKVSKNAMLVNILLSIGKLSAGILGHSSAMISDAFHSASDVFSTIIVMFGIQLASKKPDENHPYGHERLECVISILLAMVLALTAFMIGYNAITIIINKSYLNMPIPDFSTIIAAILSMSVKEGMYWYTIHYATLLNSSALKADAWHHRSDALSSIGALFGIIAARCHFLIGDSLASIIIAFCILKAAYDIFRDAIDKMVDKSIDKATQKRMKKLILKQEGVLSLDMLHTRLFGSKIYVDVEIGVEGQLTLYEAHKIAERVHDQIEEKFANVKHCMVHVNPSKTKKEIH